MDIAATVRKAAKMSGELGIRTLDLQADITELAERVTAQAETIEAIGGEAVRLIFAKLMLTKDNVLVLDEPTNHLDLESIVALGEALTKYEGSCFVVSHDRDLISSFATRIWAFTEKGFVDFWGTYDDYVAKHGAIEAAARKKK